MEDKMKKVFVQFEFDTPFDDETTRKLMRYLLQDAMYEFISHRGPTAEDYVNKRYPGNEVYPEGEMREDKIKQVDNRRMLAQAIHHGAFEMQMLIFDTTIYCDYCDKPVEEEDCAVWKEDGITVCHDCNIPAKEE